MGAENGIHLAGTLLRHSEDGGRRRSASEALCRILSGWKESRRRDGGDMERALGSPSGLRNTKAHSGT